MSRNKTPRGNLPPRPLAVRARADAGLVGQYQRAARRRRLAGDADQCLARLRSIPARLSRLDADGRLVSGDAPTKEVPLHTALYQTRGAARAVVHLHSTHSVALSMLPEIDPRAALPPMTPYYLMKCGATALVPYYRPGDPAVADAIKGLAGKYSSVLLANHGPVVSGDTLEAAVFAIEELEETAKLYLLLRGLNPRYLSPQQVADLPKVFGLVLPEHGHH